MLPLNLSCQTSARYQIQPKFKIYYESSLAHYEKKKKKKNNQSLKVSIKYFIILQKWKNYH